MRVLLCVPVTTAGYQIIPDLGLGYLATALKRAGHDPVYLDCPKERMTLEGFRRWLAANGPFDLVGFKIYSLNVVNTRQCASVVREIMPEVPIIVGGPHVSGEGVTVLKTIPQITYGIAGEGEHGLPALCDWIERGNPRDMSPLEKIPGLIYTDAEGKARINERFFEPALETVGWPDWDSIQPETYPDEASGVFVWGFPSAPTVATRGCPFPCTFCSAERVTGKAVRYRAADDIVREVIYLRDTYGVKNISFLDDNLTANKKNAMAIFNGLIEAEANIHWHCPNGVRIDLLDPEMIRAMERSGCYSLACGIESGSDRILEHMRKKQTVAKLREKIELIKAHSNISLTGFFIFGYPEETREDL